MNYVFLSLLVVLGVHSFSYAATSDLCPGQEGYYFTNYKIRNPTKGGFVSYDATVDESGENVYIGKNAAVCDFASVEGEVKISGKTVLRDYASVSGRNIEVSGNIVLAGKVRVRSNAIIRGSGSLDTGEYKDDSYFLEEQQSSGARIKNLFPIKTKMYHRSGNGGVPSEKWSTTEITKFQEVANSRKNGCVFDVSIETKYIDTSCEKDKFEQFSFRVDFGRDISDVNRFHASGGTNFVKVNFNEATFNPSFNYFKRSSYAPNCEATKANFNEAKHKFVDWGITLFYSTDNTELQNFKSKLVEAIQTCR